MNDKMSRERRRPWWQALVGAAAALAIVGGTGLGIGLSGIGAPASSAAYASGSLNESAAEADIEGDGRPLSGAKADAIANIYGEQYAYPAMERYTYTAMGLSAEAGTADGYSFDPRSASNREAITALAAALGMDGVPQLNDNAWIVGAQDGKGPTIYVSLDSTLSFSYTNPAIQAWSCDLNSGCAAIGELPSEESALTTLRNVVGKLGYGSSDFEFAADTSEGRLTTLASARQLVDGKRTDRQIVVEVAEGGITYVNGSLAPLVELGKYSIVSERDAFTRLYDSRFGGSMGGFSGPMLTGFAATEYWASPTEAPATPVPGASIGWPVTNVHIVSSSLGLASQHQPDGTALLIPSYEFTDSNGGNWSVIAVDESYLDFSAE
ncbi:MAG: hypothetical protein ACOH19_16030 [Rhodoglobus sp.]